MFDEEVFMRHFDGKSKKIVANLSGRYRSSFLSTSQFLFCTILSEHFLNTNDQVKMSLLEIKD